MQSPTTIDRQTECRDSGAEAPRVVLVRHAQASLGSSDYDKLSPMGHDQARLLAERLRRDYPVSGLVRGEHRRHRETVEPLALPDASIDPDLNEYSVAALMRAAAARAEDLEIDFPGPEAEQNPAAFLNEFLRLFPKVLAAWQGAAIACEINGPWAGFRSRVDSAAERLDALARRNGTALAITSAGVISTMAAGLLQRDLGWQRELNVALYNSAVTELRLDGQGRWVAESVNCVAHLPDPSLHSLA